MPRKNLIVGIDLGTTNSVIAIYENGDFTVIPNAEGSRLTPSVVAFTKEKEVLVGEPAKRQAVLNPDRTIRSIKRKMGTDHRVKIDDKEYTPEEISAFILQKLKKDAEAYLGERIEKAVITVPAYFSNPQRQATKDAGRIAGLDVVRIINEPTAAALAYGLDKTGDHTIAVFDLGGGTFDISILEVGEGVFQVKSTAGDTHLGGDDMDQAILEWMVREFHREHGIDLSNDRVALQRLRDAAEKAKIELSNVMETTISLPFITSDASGPKHLELKLTRTYFESLIQPLLARIEGPCRRAMADAKLTPNQIDKVILVGGATRVPAVQALVRELFIKEPTKGVNPDEAVAIGAAIQASVLAGETREVVLVDVTPLTLGVEVLGGVVAKLIPRNSAIPIRKSETFSTATDNQTSVEIHIVQGEREMAADNISLGRFMLTGIPPAPRGVPQIEVTFEIDSNGILNVTAKDLATNKSQSITVTGSTNLNEEEIQKRIREAELHQEEDKKRRKLVEARNTLDATIYQAEKVLREYGDRISSEEKENIEKILAEARDVHKKGTLEELTAMNTKVLMAMHKVSEQLYRTAQQAAGAGAGTGSAQASSTPPPEDRVIEADYEEEK
ncbi:MAG: molecular chaperone DnaK [bacterium JZ-2024 1]